MLRTKLVIRVLDVSGALLGWTEHQAWVRGDGQLWATAPVVVMPEVSGTPHAVSTHWCDVNVETRVPWPAECPGAIVRDQAILLFHDGTPILQVGQPPIGLPAVTVKQPVAVAVPMGAVGMQPVSLEAPALVG